MAFLDRATLAPPSVRRETVPLPSLGGDVIVRSRMLADRLVLNTVQAQAQAALPGEAEEHAMVRVGAAVVAQALALQVVLEDGQPMWSAEQWARHGSDHPDEVLALYAAAERLSGSDAKELEKN